MPEQRPSYVNHKARTLLIVDVPNQYYRDACRAFPDFHVVNVGSQLVGFSKERVIIAVRGISDEEILLLRRVLRPAGEFVTDTPKAIWRRLKGLTSMGYTHYFTEKPFSDDEWIEASAAIKEICRLAAQSGVVMRDGSGEADTKPEFAESHMSFNGAEEQNAACESFWIDKNSTEWTFCKTAARPYDIAVVAALTYLAARFDWRVTSDGDEQDWESGIMLAKLAVPSLSERCKWPADRKAA